MANSEEMRLARGQAARCVDALRAMGYEPEAVRASGGEWDGLEPLASERTRLEIGGGAVTFGSLLTLADCDRLEDLRGVRGFVEDVEARGAAVYAVIVDHVRADMGGGLWLTALCVDADMPETWEGELADLRAGVAFCASRSPIGYGETEFGTCTVRAAGGGLLREG